VPKPTKARMRKPKAIGPYVETLLQGINAGKNMLTVRKGVRIFSQGDQTDAVYFIENGKVKISVVSGRGKEAVLVLLGAQEFFGEGCLVGQPLRINTATTLELTTLFRVEKRAMMRALASQPKEREIHRVPSDTQHQPRGRPLRSAFQSQ
jgi:CRP/FNR family transcriptional regulator, cyclic AMP receptor protein